MEADLHRLRAQNHALSEDLAQCQADKDFVWSLWKRLQVASPDMTQAINMVMRREKEKEDLKDRKVLEILQKKDDKAYQLEQQLREQDTELSLLTATKLELQDQLNAQEVVVQQLKARTEDLESRGPNLNDAGRDTIRELDKQCLDLKQQTSKHSSEITTAKQEKNDLQSLYEMSCQKVKDLESKAENDLKRMEDLQEKVMNLEKQLEANEQKLADANRELDSKSRELENIRREMKNLWQTNKQTSEHVTQQADIILQLQSLQKDTNKVIRNQEDAFSMESVTIQNEYQSLKVSEQELRLQLQQYQTRAEQQDDIILNLQSHLDSQREIAVQVSMPSEDKDVQAFEIVPEMEYQLESLQVEVGLLRERLKEANRARDDDYGRPKTRIKEPFRCDARHRRGRSLSERRCMSEKVKPVMRRATHSASPHRQSDIQLLQKQLSVTENKLQSAQTQISIKQRELDELRRCHSRRLERLKAIQSNQRLLKKEILLLEEEYYGKKKKRTQLRRSDPKSLQKEDSDTVWNELTYFKKENKNLMVERLNLQEECDMLSVRAAQDAATIHELQMCLELEREELELALKEREEENLRHQSVSHPSPAEMGLDRAQNQIRQLERQLTQMEKHLDGTKQAQQEMITEKESLAEQSRCAKREVNQLLQQAARHRIQLSDLRRELSKCQRELKKRNRKKEKTTMAKQYQKILNGSIREMSQTFKDFDKEGWVEVSDTEEITDDAGGDLTGTTDSLGQQIIQHASTRTNSPGKLPNSHRQMESVDDHIKRMNKKNETPVKDTTPRLHRSASPEILTRSVALSPIHMGYDEMTPQPVARRSRGSSFGGRTGTALKQRVAALQRQVTSFRQSRDAASKGLEEQKRKVEMLNTDLSLSNQRLQSTRLTVQRLTGEVERLRTDKDILEQQVESQSVDTSITQRPEQEWMAMASKLRHANIDVSRQLAQIKQLKADHTSQLEHVQELKDKVNHQDRDLSQKRNLIEDMKIKMKVTQENAQSDADVMLDVETKLKTLAETNSRYKTQAESLRKRNAVITKEKHDSEDRLHKQSVELERKNRQNGELHKQQLELQGTVTALEQAAQRQLHALAGHTEAAIDTARQKLTHASDTINEYNKFIKVLAHAVLNSTQQARLLCQQKQQQEQQRLQKKKLKAVSEEERDPALRKAQDLACDILNLSQSDIQNLMSCTEDDEDDNTHIPERDTKTSNGDARRDQRWVRKWTRILKKQDFSLPLVDLFMEKMEERVKLAQTLTSC